MVTGAQAVRDHLNKEAGIETEDSEVTGAQSIRDGLYSRAKPTAKGGKLIPPVGLKRVFKHMEIENEKDSNCKSDTSHAKR